MSTPEMVEKCIIYVDGKPRNATNLTLSLMGLRNEQVISIDQYAELIRHQLVGIWLESYLKRLSRRSRPGRS